MTRFMERDETSRVQTLSSAETVGFLRRPPHPVRGHDDLVLAQVTRERAAAERSVQPRPVSSFTFRSRRRSPCRSTWRRLQRLACSRSRHSSFRCADESRRIR